MKVELKNKSEYCSKCHTEIKYCICGKKQKFLLGLFIGAFFVLNGIVFGAILFSNTSSVSGNITGTPTNLTIIRDFPSNFTFTMNSTNTIVNYSKKMLVDWNATFLLNFDVVKTPNNLSCVDYQNDCKVFMLHQDFSGGLVYNQSLIDGQNITLWSGIFQDESNIFNLYIQCVPNLCSQNINVDVGLTENSVAL